MKTRKERPVINRKEGAAIRQDHRSNGYPATRRTTIESIPAWADEEEWSRPKTIAIIVVGALFLYAFMWLAAAY
jgi:hypothetical protein